MRPRLMQSQGTPAVGYVSKRGIDGELLDEGRVGTYLAAESWSNGGFPRGPISAVQYCATEA